MENKISNFLLFSGGCDSTYLFAYLMDLHKTEQDYFLHLVQINSNLISKDQIKFENKAIKFILNKYKKLYPNKFDFDDNKKYIITDQST